VTIKGIHVFECLLLSLFSGRNIFKIKNYQTLLTFLYKQLLNFDFFAGPSSNILPYFTSGHEHGIISTAIRLAWSLV